MLFHGICFPTFLYDLIAEINQSAVQFPKLKVFRRPKRRLKAVRHLDFAINVVNVGLDGICTDP